MNPIIFFDFKTNGEKKRYFFCCSSRWQYGLFTRELLSLIGVKQNEGCGNACTPRKQALTLRFLERQIIPASFIFKSKALFLIRRNSVPHNYRLMSMEAPAIIHVPGCGRLPKS